MDLEGPEASAAQRWTVPSPEHPTLAAAVEQAFDGTHIQVLSGYSECLAGPLILDRSIFLDGPADCSALITGEEGLIVAAGAALNTVVLRRLRIRVVGGCPALLLAGGCTVDRCEVETAGSGVGIEVAAHSGNAVQILRSVIRDCQVGVSLAGGAAAAVLDGSHVERCVCGVALTGLHVGEGWSEVLVSLAGASLALNSEADLRLRAWSVQEQASGLIRHAPPGEEVSVCGWPGEQCNVVAPTDRGPVVLHFNGGKVNATLFEDEDEGCAGSEEDGLEEGLSFCELSLPDKAAAGSDL
ncbi:unnamed protein product [Polarella glacialis]|uniref:Right handed beta helix domain-containing protein n=1 Tax=Polarella glacialis TaxID=89957 RepID=A0A813GPR8_POLGL|nr:unnamed protein product [Polarella glacialis]CAE8737387.1 unnamed protein product [Polarella glacialis]